MNEEMLKYFDKFTLDNDWAGEHYNQLKFLISSLIDIKKATD